MEQLQKETGLWLTDCNHEDILESMILSPENEQEVDAGFYLHGICGVFALALHNRFGYHIEWALDDEWEVEKEDEEESSEPDAQEYDPWEHLIHIYCIMPPSGSKESLIDIRGITQDEDRFFEPFEDFFTDLNYYAPCEDASHELRNKLHETMGEESFRLHYDCACRMIDLHPDWFILP